MLPMGLFRRLLVKEVLFSGHYMLSGLFLYAAWRHLPPKGLLPRLYMYVVAGVLLTMTLLRVAILLALFRKDFQLCRAEVSHPSGATLITVTLPKRVKAELGQQVYLWTLTNPLCIFA